MQKPDAPPPQDPVDLEQLIRKTARRILPTLSQDQIRARVARRSLAALQRPPREWCLVVRASDRRINWDETLILQTEKIGTELIRLDRRFILELCRPIQIPRPGLPVKDLAALLGVSYAGLTAARLKGWLRANYINWRGRRLPLLYSDRPVDPSTYSFEPKDDLWGWTAQHMLSRVPQDFCQDVKRFSVYRNLNRKYQDRNLHPEHPDFIPATPRRPPLPKPPPDYASYKWKNGQYLGYDWKNPAAGSAYEQKQRANFLNNQRRIQKRKNQQRRSGQFQGTLPCCGKRFICPKCEKPARYLFLPLPPPAIAPMADLNQIQRLRARRRTHAPRPRWETRFLCVQCHRVRCISFIRDNAWNEIVTYLSGGLLYGREVPRQLQTADPARRKYKYTPRLTYGPSERREAVLRLLRQGLTVNQIAQNLARSPVTIYKHVARILGEHRVKTRQELAQKLGFITPTQTTKRDHVDHPPAPRPPQLPHPVSGRTAGAFLVSRRAAH